jgi:Ca-activated chloride channel family protein
LLLPLINLPGPALAAEAEPAAAPHSLWRDLWQRPDQQAQQALQAGDAKSAAAQFRDPAWRGAAQYRAGDFEAAAQTLQGQGSFDADYNRGNALARAGHLQEAIAAYDAALQKSPDAEDAKANRALVENLLRQQQQQPNQQNQQQDKSSQDSSAQSQGGRPQDDQSQTSQPQDKSQDRQAGDDQSQSDQARNQQSQNQNNQAPQNDPAAAQGKSGQEQHGADSPPKNNAADRQAAGQSQSSEENASRNEKADRGDATQSEQTQDDASAKATGAAPGDREQQRQQHATEQWLRQIPDDPSGLLRRKFLYEHRQRERTAQPRDNEQPQW